MLTSTALCSTTQSYASAAGQGTAQEEKPTDTGITGMHVHVHVYVHVHVCIIHCEIFVVKNTLPTPNSISHILNNKVHGVF